MASTTAPACPIVGTTNDVLPPNHPDIDLSQSGQTCPIVGATTDHHHTLSKHPAIPISNSHSPAIATSCPALKTVVNEPKNKAMDDEVCPVIGPATTVLPPGHPSTAGVEGGEGAVCPVTKATVGHHRGRVHGHPDVQGAAEGAVCPVAGVRV